MKNNRQAFFLVACMLLLSAVPARAGENWRTRAHLDVEVPGLVEAVLPPELVSQGKNGALELTLTGPDGHPRAFELYWRDRRGPVRLSLKPETLRINEKGAVVWEARVPPNILVRRLLVNLTQADAVGKIDVFGQVAGKWQPLVRSAAVFANTASGAGGIGLPENAYERLRLVLTGYDFRIRQTLSPLRSVILEGKRAGRDYVTRELSLPFRQSRSEGLHVIEAVLPGEGLWIKTLALATEAHFQGDWQVGRERILDGARHFTPLLEGRVTEMDLYGKAVTLQADRYWPGRSLELRLDAGERYIGHVVSFSATVRLPRLVFYADKAGRYTAMSGAGGAARILAHPAERYRKPEVESVFSAAETNPRWRLASLVEKYRFKGGAFDPKGYAWRAPVDIGAPGYYRLALNLEAAMGSHGGGVRMVRDGIQVPYVSGRTEECSVDLKTEAVYEAKRNTTVWTLHLPGPSPCWKALTLYAAGIFKRRVSLQTPKPGIDRWQTWRNAVWESRGQRKTDLRLSLRDLPKGTTGLRLVMPHGDNQPVTVSKIAAVYETPTLYFLANSPGQYLLYGGNPEAGAPRYDLSLVQSELFSALPVEAHMGQVQPIAGPGWGRLISDAFQGRGWGLYVVLGLVTLVLIIVILRLFPKPTDGHPG